MSTNKRLLILASGLFLLLPSCGVAEVKSAPPTQVADFEHIPNQMPPQQPGIPGAGIAPVGGCVALTGPRTSVQLSVVDCKSPQNGYKVVQRVSTPDQCVGDVDQRFYMNPPEGQFTACLDYAWSSTDCLSIGKYTATRVACDAVAEGDREKPVRLITDSTSLSDCPTGGFAHRVRRFTVCTETQK